MANFHVDYNYLDHLNAPRRIVADLAISLVSGAGNTITSAVGSAAMAWTTHGIAAGPGDVLDIPTYLGAFRIPSGGVKTASQLAYGSITGRKVGGVNHIIYTGNESVYHGPIYELIDPGTYNTNYLISPEATIYGDYSSDGYANQRGTWRGPSEAAPPNEPMFVVSGVNNAGLYWNEDKQRLYLAYADNYNVGGYKDWGLISIELSALVGGVGTTTAHGPWRIKTTDADGVSHWGPHRASYFCAHPTTGQMFVGASLGSGNASFSWGPSMYGGLDWPDDDTPSGMLAPDLIAPDRYLNFYFMGTKITSDGAMIAPHILRSFRRRVDPPIHENGDHAGTPPTQVNGQVYTDAIGMTGSWNERDYTGGHIWIQGTNKQGIIICGVAIGSPSQDPTNPYAGHEFYGNSVNNWTCTHGHHFQDYFPGFGDPDTGPCAFAAFPFMMCYDPADIEAVKNTSSDYVPEPIWFINLNTQFPGFRTSDENSRKWGQLSMGYWDPDTSRLFVMAPGADNSTPSTATEAQLFHVFQFSGV